MAEARTSRKRRVLLWTLGVLALLVLVAVVLLSLAVSTDTGTERLLAAIGKYLPEGLDLGTVKGPLRGPLELEGVVYDTPSMRVEIERVHLEWNLRSLAARSVSISSLVAEGIRIELRESDEPPSEDPLPDVNLPVAIRLRSAELRRIEIVQPDVDPEPEPMRIESIQLAGRVADGRVELEDLAVAAPRLAAGLALPSLTARGNLETLGAYPLDLTADWTLITGEEATAEAPAEPLTWRGGGRLGGRLGEALQIDQRVTTPLEATLQGTLRPLDGTAFDLDLVLARLSLQDLGLMAQPAATTGAAADVIAGKLHLEGTPEEFTAQGDFDLDTTIVGAGQAEVRVAGSTSRFDVQPLRLTLSELGPTAGQVANVELRGEVDLQGEEPRLDLQGRWQDLALPPVPQRTAPAEGEEAAEPILSPRGSLTITGPLEDYRLEATAELQGGGLPPGEWQLAGQGSTQRLRLEPLEGELLGGSVRATGEVAWSPAVLWDLDLRADGLSPGAFWEDWPGQVGMTAATSGEVGEARVAGSLDLQRLRGSLRGQPLAGGGQAAFEIATTEGGAPAPWQVSLQNLAVSLGPARLQASGQVSGRDGAEPTTDLRFELRVPDLTLLLPEEGSPLRGGSLLATGRLDDYRVTADVRVAGEGIPPGRWQLAGRGDLEGLRLESLAGDVLEGQVQATGRVSWTPEVRWDLELTGSELQPGTFWPDWPGEVGLAMTSTGQLVESALSGSINLARLDGNLRDESLEGSGGARFEMALAGEEAEAPAGDLELDLDDLALRLGSARLQASGSYAAEADLTFALELPDLTTVLPDAEGSFEAQGTLRGSPRAPRVEAELGGRNLEWGDYRVERLEGQVNFEGTPATTPDAGLFGLDWDSGFDVDLEAGGVQLAGLDLASELALPETLDAVTVSGEGTLASHQARVEVSGGAQPAVELAATGGLGEGPGEAAFQWQGSLDTLLLSGSRLRQAGGGRYWDEIGDWRLERPARVAFGGATRIEGFCWQGQQGQQGADSTTSPRLCLDAAAPASGRWNVNATLTAFPLEMLSFALPPELAVRGDLNGEARARVEPGGGGAGVLRAQFRLEAPEGSLRLRQAGQRDVRLEYRAAQVRGTVDGQGTRAELSADLGPEGRVQASLELPGFASAAAPPPEQPLSGRIDARLADLSPFAPLVPQIRGLAGRLVVDSRLSGTVGQPAFLGEARLEEGQAELPDFGLDFQNVQLTATGQQDGTIRLEGSLESGEGQLAVTGTTGLVPSEQTPLDLQLEGQNIEARPLPGARLTVAPDLAVRLTGETVRVTGDLRIPEGEIELKEPPEDVPSVSPDVVYVAGRPESEPVEEDLAVSARIRLILGGGTGRQDARGIGKGTSVIFEGFGFRGQPEGSLLIITEPGRPVLATGELQVDSGRYRAYGQDLTLERGRLVFAGGPIDNPGLDLRAYRRATDGTIAGLEITGTLQQPETRLYSEPAMGQSEALAYLLLGRPLNQTSSSDGDLLTRAATSLGLKGGNLLAGKLATRFGLEEARIDTEGGLDQAALVLGTYLSPRLWISYGVGLFEPVNTLRLRYLLSSKWTLQAESGAESSADLLYKIER